LYVLNVLKAVVPEQDSDWVGVDPFSIFR